MSNAVTVNGKIAESPGMQIDPDNDKIEVDGKVVHFNPKDDKIYIILNKLPGYLSAVSDSRGTPTIMELLPDMGKRLFPIGRLDKDTEGLIIITNDGDLSYQLTHPKHNVDKVYLVWTNGTPSESSLEKLRQGIELENGTTAPAMVEIENALTHSIDSNITCLRMTIHEGKKRQIKRMVSAIGHKTLRLKRIKIGPIALGDLQPGKYRHLNKKEIEALKNLNK